MTIASVGSSGTDGNGVEDGALPPGATSGGGGAAPSAVAPSGTTANRRAMSADFFPPTGRPRARSLSFSWGTVKEADRAPASFSRSSPSTASARARNGRTVYREDIVAKPARGAARTAIEPTRIIERIFMAARAIPLFVCTVI
eukprot:CAMPEP_0194314052 /NCGR_PEP_ID=MMETSP0171-20130528/10875_1 /TAXON_ID=218684 /ORGANISM="Corethron pennatum, Strain L29A3" /LENGTH=142 /DNA_ID=CAMNT_0039069271 /DNA_START=552 /DNA_END=980 /DNA_ORIENTATION=-